MDYIRQLGAMVLDHRFRRMSEALLRSAEELYSARGLPFRGRWASTFTLLHAEGPLAIGQIADQLKLTHPGVIGITHEMAAADIVVTVRDASDARRRLIELTPRGRQLSEELFALWKELGEAQLRRFKAAGCNIIDVLEHVEDGLQSHPLAEEILAKREAPQSRKKKRSLPMRATRVTRCLLIASVAAFASPRVVRAQETIDASVRAAVVNALSDSLINGYVYEDKGRMIADSLRAALRLGAYDRMNTGDELARGINETLRRVGNDRHLGVQYLRPGGGTPVRRRPTSAEPVSRPAGISRVISAPEYGFAFAQVLEGNIGYLDLRGFSMDSAALALTDSVMALFADTKAIVIDIGRNGGGGPPVIQRLSAYFFEKPVHLVSSFMRGMEKPMERWTADPIPGKHLPKIPVYVLTSRTTFSAAESFAFGLRNHNRITIVGERTGGGGHFGAFIPLTAGFSMFLPRGLTYNPATKEGWEAEGLKPDIEVPYEKALETALGLARKQSK
jgi:DNA-binding MarR family transcriptional regulator